MGKIFCILFCILISNLLTTYGQTCNNFAFSANQIFTTCVSLPVLNSHLHWNYHTNGTVDVAFRHTGSTTDQWVAWAINLGGSGMVGSQALVALVSSNGSVQAYTSPVTAYATGLQPGSLSFDVSRISAERVNEVVVIYATLVLPRGGTRFNQVWQVGPVNNGGPSIHELNPANRNSLGSVDFSTGLTATGGGGGVGGSRQRRRNTHRVLKVAEYLKVLSGILLPVGAMVARFSKKEDNHKAAWFYIHAACQTAAYGVAIAAWAIGLKLRIRGDYTGNRNIGNTISALGTVQVCAPLLKPKPDHKCRCSCWKICHQSIGYSLIVLSIINVYEGLDILDSEKTWRKIYTGILISLGVITVVREAWRCCRK